MAYISINQDIDIDLDDILKVISDAQIDMLIERASQKRRKGADKGFGDRWALFFNAWDYENLKGALAVGDDREVVRLMKRSGSFERLGPVCDQSRREVQLALENSASQTAH